MFVNIGTKEKPLHVVEGKIAMRRYRSTLENQEDFTWDGYWQYTQKIWDHYGKQAPQPQKLSGN